MWLSEGGRPERRKRVSKEELGQRLDQALADYAEISGRQLSPEAVDPRRPEHRAAYKAFARKPVDFGLGANEGEWMGFTLRLKPLVREVVSMAEWERRGPDYKAQGLHAQALNIGIGQDPFHGYTMGSAGRDQMIIALPEDSDKEWWTAWKRSAGSKVLMCVGRDPERVHRALEVDRLMLDAEDRENEAALTQEHGELLGYPSCCIDAYVAAQPILRNRDPIARAAAATQTFSFLLNNLTLTAFHYIGWYPCSYDCEPSMRYAHRLDKELMRLRPRVRKALHWATSMPRLYLDDRRQILLEGMPQSRSDGRAEFSLKSAWTPWTLDRSKATTMVDWIFFRDAVWPLLSADRLVVGPDTLELHKAGELVERRPRSAEMVLLPFQSEVHR